MTIVITSWVTNCEWYDKETDECVKFGIRCDDVDINKCEDVLNGTTFGIRFNKEGDNGL